MIKHVYIEIVKRGDDTGQVVQYAYDTAHAYTMINTIMPKLRAGYYYKIITI